MNSAQSLPVDAPPSKAAVTLTCQKFFYTGSAALLFILMFWGFHLFYLHGQAYPGRPLTPPIRPLLIAHGIAMMSWMVLFMVQPLLVATGNRRIHMKVGVFGATLALVVTFLGVQVAIGAASVNPPDLKLWGLAPKQFMMVSLSAIILFALFVGIGILNRKHRDIHRPMMLLATLSAIPAALDRITVLHNLFEGTVLGALFGAYASSLVIGLVLLGLNWVLTRSLNRWFAIGYTGIAIVAFATMHLAPTQAWDSVASLLVH